jgi:hypothetical protein
MCWPCGQKAMHRWVWGVGGGEGVVGVCCTAPRWLCWAKALVAPPGVSAWRHPRLLCKWPHCVPSTDHDACLFVRAPFQRPSLCASSMHARWNSHTRPCTWGGTHACLAGACQRHDNQHHGLGGGVGVRAAQARSSYDEGRRGAGCGQRAASQPTDHRPQGVGAWGKGGGVGVSDSWVLVRRYLHRTHQHAALVLHVWLLSHVQVRPPTPPTPRLFQGSMPGTSVVKLMRSEGVVTRSRENRAKARAVRVCVWGGD